MSRRGTSLRSSEPRVLVSGGKDGRWSADGKTVDETLCSGVQSWVYAFNGDYIGHRDITKRDLDRYDIIIMNTNVPHRPLLRLAQERPPSTKWISLIEGSADEYLRPQGDFKTLLDVSDLVNVINHHSLPMFRSLTKSKVEYIGLPYPVDGVKKFIVPVGTRSRRIFLCGPLLRRWNDYLAASAIGLPYYGYEIRKVHPGARTRLLELIRTRSWSWDSEENINKARALYGDGSLDIATFTKDVKRYLIEHGGAYLWMNLDGRYTWARFVLDAAALCLPIITTSSTYHGEIFFPETTVAHAMDIERAIEIGRRLNNDREFYQHVAEYPAEKMDFLRAEPMKRALLAALELG
jgi:hypothetical protein